MTNNKPNFVNNVLITDEAHFELNRSVNKQNDRYWNEQNPRKIHEKSLHPFIVCDRMDWCYINENHRTIFF